MLYLEDYLESESLNNDFAFFLLNFHKALPKNSS